MKDSPDKIKAFQKISESLAKQQPEVSEKIIKEISSKAVSDIQSLDAKTAFKNIVENFKKVGVERENVATAVADSMDQLKNISPDIKNVLDMSRQAVIGSSTKAEQVVASILTQSSLVNPPAKLIPVANSYLQASASLVGDPQAVRAIRDNFISIARSENPKKTIEVVSKQLSVPDFTKVQMQRIFSLNSGNIDVQQFFTFSKNPELARLFSQSFSQPITAATTTSVYAPVLGQSSFKAMVQNSVTNMQIFVKSVNLPVWVLPTTFGAVGTVVAGPAGAVAGTLGGVAATKIMSPETQVLPELISYVPQVFNAGFNAAKNYMWNSATDFAKVIGVTFLALGSMTLLTYFIIIYSALIVPPNKDPFRNYGGSLHSENEFIISGSCPVTDPVISAGSLNSGLGTVEHGGKGYGKVCYGIPIEGMYQWYDKPANDETFQRCPGEYNKIACNTVSCPYFGFATDVEYPKEERGPIVLPKICDKTSNSSDCGEMTWKIAASFYNCFGGTAKDKNDCTRLQGGNANTYWGWGVIFESDDNNHHWKLYLNHIDSNDNIYYNKEYRSGQVFGTITKDFVSHVHIELIVDDIPARPDYLCKTK
ncbi:hypothetical protein HZB69_02070 [Candidatus Amesbacteria bacterium]|nr:hypothetical protein [Candidatus Amesbacteria bacterium]